MGRSPSRNDRDRRDRDRDRDRHHRPSSKDHSGDVARMREKMRNSLETARNSSDFTKTTAERREKREELTAAEHLARTKAIAEIEEGHFQPSTFRSGSAPKKDQKSKKETSHDAAIFGPAWKSAEQRKVIEKREKDVSLISLPSAPTPPLFAMAPMIPSSMSSEHSAQRKADWKSYWSTLRHELLADGF